MPVQAEPKYIFVEGVMKKNPKYVPEQKSGEEQKSSVADPYKALAIVSSTKDIELASEAKEKAGAGPVQLSEATISSMEIMQDPEYLKKFNSPKELDGGDLLDGISNFFARYEVPIGLVNKLLALTEYKLNFIIDDSGSMGGFSDVSIKDATLLLKKRDPQGARASSYNPNMTRWEEAENRIHIMMEMIAYIPTGTITISFLNRKDKLTLEHAGKNPENFIKEAQEKVFQLFNSKPAGLTPLYSRLKEAFTESKESTMHYVFTDGVPSDRSVDEVKELVLNRKNPQMNPLTFISCTDEEDEANWMKEIEEKAPYTSEVDDFISERSEVQKDQGPGFPYSKGVWLLCQLVSAINPTDLDALDESVPFSKKTMNNLLGRKLSSHEYKQYFDNNPNAVNHKHLYSQFEREDITAQQILKLKAGAQSSGFFSQIFSSSSSQSEPLSEYEPGLSR